MKKYCAKCDKIFDNGEKFCSQCGAKLVKSDFEGPKKKVEAYYRKMFAGTNTDIVIRKDGDLVVILKDPLGGYDKVFAKICDKKKSDFLRYSISIECFNGPRLALRIAPREGYVHMGIFDVHVWGSITPKNIERLKKYIDEKAVQLEIEKVQGWLKHTEKTINSYKAEQKMWSKCLRLLEKKKGDE